jgi:uncharacterized membrane protein YgdD (TMEM256/DUF423 family)
MNSSENKKWMGVGAALLGVTVGCGAFGAHGLKDVLSPYALSVFETAVLYQFIHSFAIVLIAILAEIHCLAASRARLLCRIFFAGICFFSGSLYVLAVSGVKILGAITPIGGTLFLIGWFLSASSLLRR